MGIHSEQSSASYKNYLRRPMAYVAAGAGAVIVAGVMTLGRMVPNVEGEHLPSAHPDSNPYSTQYSEATLAARAEALRSPTALRHLGICASELQAELNYETRRQAALGEHALHIVADTRHGLQLAKEANLIQCATNPNDDRSVTLHDGSIVHRQEVTRFRSAPWCSDRQELTSNAQDGIIDVNNQLTAWIKSGDAVFKPCSEIT